MDGADVNERNRAEEGQRHGDTWHRLLFENMLDGYAYCRMVFDECGRPQDFVYLDVNASFQRLTGLHDVVGKKVTEVIPGIRDAHPELLETYGRVARTGRPERFELELRPLGMWLDISVYSPRLDHFVAVFDNTTDRKRAQEQLRGAWQRLDSLLQNSPLAVVEWSSSDFSVSRWSKEATRIFGWSADEVVGKRVDELDLVYPADWPLVRETMADMLSGKRPRNVTKNRNLRKDGSVIRCEWYNSTVADESGKLVGVLSLVLDVTQARRAEDLTRRQNAIVAGIARIFREALTCATQEDLGRVCLAVAEDVTQSKFGFLGEVNHGTGLMDDVAISDPGWDACRLPDASGHGRRPPIAFEIHGLYGRVLKDGKSLFSNDPRSHGDSIGVPPGHPTLTAFLGVPLVRTGETIGMIGLGNREGGYGPEEVEAVEALAPAIVQAFESKRADDALRAANAQLREADKRKSEFLAVLSHELRNPLAPIRNSIYLLERAEPDSEQAARAQDVIRRQTDHLARLVDDLLDVTRISRGKIELQRAVIDAREVVARVCDDHRTSLQARGQHLRVVISDHVWIEADETRIAQIVGNLLQNAAKFGRAGGTVTVSVDTVGGQAQISVRDDGMGISPDLLPRLFEAFVQADGGLARAKGGLGLGLALVKGLAELHGGSARVHSAGPGQGAEFVVTLPLARPTTRPAPGQAASVVTPGIEVLIIEDNVDAAQTMAEVLEMEGHRVHVAYDGLSGLAKARALKPEAILCDIGLPDVDGYEIARTLRADDALRSTRLVALSGYAQPEDRQRAADSGFDEHLSKPPSLSALMASLARSRPG